MRIPIPLVVEMTDDQVKEFAKWHGLPQPVRAKDVVTRMRSEVLGELTRMHSDLNEFTDITIKS